MKAAFSLFLLAAALTLTSCIKDQEDSFVENYTDEQFATISKHLSLPREATDYTLHLPPHLGGFDVNSDKHQAALGRVLFYDERLSANNTVSCASCHKTEKAFADDVAFSKGFEERETARNSLALAAFPSFNAYYGFGGSRLFWDERAGSVEEQSTQTLQNPIEMGADLNELYGKLIGEDYYKVLFEKAFPNNRNGFSGEVSSDRKVLLALQSFVNSIGVFNSKYDDALSLSGNPEVSFVQFSPQENLGKQLFNTHCASCHNLGVGFSTAVTTANNGLDMNYTDQGLSGVSHLEKEKGVFKVPMLRNVALTGPYMHDGRFATLEDVVEHYSEGIQNHPNLHENLRDSDTGEPKLLHLNQQEKGALVTFLNTLTDVSSISHEKYSNPFK